MRLAPAGPTVVLLLCAAAPARADGELILRGNYWRDRNTRVLAPEAVLRKTAPTGTTFEASYLLDAITSASAAAGVSADEPFTELRNEVGARLGQAVGPVTLSAFYRYSTESDYWAHVAGGSVIVDLLQKNLTLAVNYVYSHADVARRVSAVGYAWATSRDGVNNYFKSVLETNYLSLTAAQVLAPWALLNLGFDFFDSDGFQSNPYRTALVSGTPVRETVPAKRQRYAGAVGLRLTVLSHRGVLDHLTFLASYRLYAESWNIVGHTPELRTYLGLGPTELRLTVRGITQSAAAFYRDSYAAGPIQFHDCPRIDNNSPALCATGDSKLSAFDAVFVELRFALELRAIFGTRVGLARWIGRGVVGISGGHYWNDGAPERQFGDAWVGGLDLTFPL